MSPTRSDRKRRGSLRSLGTDTTRRSVRPPAQTTSDRKLRGCYVYLSVLTVPRHRKLPQLWRDSLLNTKMSDNSSDEEVLVLTLALAVAEEEEQEEKQWIHPICASRE